MTRRNNQASSGPVVAFIRGGSSGSQRQGPAWAGHPNLTVAWTTNSGWQPRADIYESEDAYFFQIEATGLESHQITARYEPGQLTIEGERSRPGCSPVRRCLQVEMDYGPFRRVFALPREIDGAGIEARLENGILHVTVPKRTQPPTSTRISIK